MQSFIDEHINDDVRLLALKFKKNAEFDFALQQIAARQRIKYKLPSWYNNKNLVFPPSISLEQCSSEATAEYKAKLCGGHTLVDLTGGFGVDIAFMSKAFEKAIYVERNEDLANIARYNFAALALPHIDVAIDDAINFIPKIEKVDCIYIDPARRDKHNNKQVLLENCEPNILEIKSSLLERAKTVLIKLSPLFDISQLIRQFEDVEQIHIIAVNNECKELLVKLSQNNTNTDVEIVCVNINKEQSSVFSFYYSQEREADYNFVQTPQKYLYEPNAAIQKSGGFRLFAKENNLNALNANSKIYTSDSLIENFCGRTFIIDSIISFNKNDLKKHLSDVDKANITVRNFPLSVAELRKKLKIAEGGDIYIFASTLFDGKKVLIKCLSSKNYER